MFEVLSFWFSQEKSQCVFDSLTYWETRDPVNEMRKGEFPHPRFRSEPQEMEVLEDFEGFKMF